MFETLMEAVVGDENRQQALRAVTRKQGAAGIDRMTMAQLGPHLQANWWILKDKLLQGSFVPTPVRRVEIPKPSGGVRMLGIPTVQDRFIASSSSCTRRDGAPASDCQRHDGGIAAGPRRCSYRSRGDWTRNRLYLYGGSAQTHHGSRQESGAAGGSRRAGSPGDRAETGAAFAPVGNAGAGRHGALRH